MDDILMLDTTAVVSEDIQNVVSVCVSRACLQQMTQLPF